MMIMIMIIIIIIIHNNNTEMDTILVMLAGVQARVGARSQNARMGERGGEEQLHHNIIITILLLYYYNYYYCYYYYYYGFELTCSQGCVFKLESAVVSRWQ